MSAETPENRQKTGKQSPGEATRFQPGQSGNPGGRPKTAPLSQACREILAQPVPDDAKGRTYAEAIAETLAKNALKGDIRAAQELADRSEGKPRQRLEIEDTPRRQAFERMSSNELLTYAKTGVMPDWFSESDYANERIQ
jgi:uncharacterized protein DUF5681